MPSVSKVVANTKQPYGGYIQPKLFEKIELSRGPCYFTDENLHPTVVGLAVDYLSRFVLGCPKEEAFSVSLEGARIEKEMLNAWRSFQQAGNSDKSNMVEDYEQIAFDLLEDINGIDDRSIKKACKLVTFDVWKRNPLHAPFASGYSTTSPNRHTIRNIQHMVRTAHQFDELFGPITKFKCTFEPPNSNPSAMIEMLQRESGSYGGYTPTVSSGDGDFLTVDTIWDIKCINGRINSKHTLQLLMYYIMGKHSKQEIYDSVEKLGIYNPRLGVIQVLDTNRIPPEIIINVEKYIFKYSSD